MHHKGLNPSLSKMESVFWIWTGPKSSGLILKVQATGPRPSKRPSLLGSNKFKGLGHWAQASLAVSATHFKRSGPLGPGQPGCLLAIIFKSLGQWAQTSGVLSEQHFGKNKKGLLQGLGGYVDVFDLASLQWWGSVCVPCRIVEESMFSRMVLCRSKVGLYQGRCGRWCKLRQIFPLLASSLLSTSSGLTNTKFN